MLKVLIVDDEYIMRQGLKYMIHWDEEGYEIVGEATNGKEALQKIEETQPDIIISDIVMPMMDGVDFTDAVHQRWPQIQIIILSGYDKFEYVRRTMRNGVVDYILKPTLNPKELVDVLGRAAERIPDYKKDDSRKTQDSPENIVERYLSGRDQELDTEKLAARLNRSRFILYGVLIRHEDGSGRDISNVLYRRIERSLQEEKDIPYVCVTLREELVCIIFSYELSESRALQEKMEDLSDRLVLLGKGILPVKSREFTDLASLKDVYQSDIAANTDKAFYYEGLNLLDGSRTADTGTHVRLDFLQYNQLLTGRQFADAWQMLKTYSEDCIREEKDPTALKNQVKNLLYTFMDYVSAPDDEKDDFCFEAFKAISDAVYVSEYRKTIQSTGDSLRTLVGEGAQETDGRIQKILDYIDAHYAEELSLEDLASEFNFNYHYLSSYFSQHMKEGFVDYLNRLRIEKACGLLETTSMSIAEVGSRVGFADHSYFSRVFRKITGKTPSVWRRNLTK